MRVPMMVDGQTETKPGHRMTTQLFTSLGCDSGLYKHSYSLLLTCGVEAPFPSLSNFGRGASSFTPRRWGPEGGDKANHPDKWLRGAGEGDSLFGKATGLETWSGRS